MVVRAARAHRPSARRRHRRHRAKHGRRLTMRSFAPTTLPTSAALGQSLTGSMIAMARSGSGGSVPVGSPAAASSPALTASGSTAVNALAAQVRATATTAPTKAAGTRAASHPRTTGQHGGGHAAGSPGTTFLLPLGVPSPIEHFVNVVPRQIWIALATALALAGIGGAAAVRAGRRARRQAGEYAAVAAVAHTDQLTGVLNRRGFVDAVERELARARRYGTPFVLAYVDVRGLKAVNDSEGHLAGDAVIQEVAHLLNESVRAEDAVGRLGGDELGLLLTGQSAAGADAVIERIREEVPARREALGVATAWDVTIGTASHPADGTTFEQLVATADRRLYEQRGIHLR